MLPGLKHTCLVDHSFWQSSSASSQVANILSEYKQVAEMVCNMARFVFLEQEKFSHLPKVDVNAQELRQWSTVLPQRLPKWAHEDVVAGVDSHLLSVCKQKEKSLYSAGLAAVAIIAKQCGDGVLPAMPPETQAQLLLKIPKAHVLRPLVAAFLEASKNIFLGLLFFPTCCHLCNYLLFPLLLQVVGSQSTQGIAKGKKKTEPEKVVSGLEAMAKELQFVEHTEKAKEEWGSSGMGVAVPWLEGVARQTMKVLVDDLTKAIGQVVQLGGELTGMMQKLPSVKSEKDYRLSGLKLVGPMAKSTNALEDAAKGVKVLREAVSKLCKVCFGGVEPTPWQSDFEAFQKEKGKGDLVVAGEKETEAMSTMKVASFHVAAVAAVCMARSDKVANKGVANKQAMKELGDLTSTLKAKWDLLPTQAQKLKDEAKDLLDECEKL